MDEKVLRKTFGDIVSGYTCCPFRGRQVFIKHFSYRNQIALDDAYDKYFTEAKSKGVPTEEDQVEFLKREGLWTEEDERDLSDTQRVVEGLHKSKKHVFLPSQVEEVDRRIREKEQEYYQKLNRKTSLIGLTCEGYASKKANSFYIYESFYSDPEGLNRLYRSEDFYELDEDEVGDLSEAYVQNTEHLTAQSIKTLAISPLFQNYFSLCGDSIRDFYGKPISELTYNQIELASYGRYFKRVFDEYENIPSNIKNDPDKVIDYVQATSNARRVMGDGGGDSHARSFVGATVEDLKALGVDGDIDETHEKMKSMGKKKLKMSELIKLQT